MSRPMRTQNVRMCMDGMSTFAHRGVPQSTWHGRRQAVQAVYVDSARATAPVRSRASYEPVPVLSDADPARTHDYGLIAFGARDPLSGPLSCADSW